MCFSEEKQKTRYGEKNSKKDTNKIHDRSHLSILHFFLQFLEFDI